MEGYLMLSRKFFKNALWTQSRTFSPAEAWIDLIVSARFEAGTEIVNDKWIQLERGEQIASVRYLMKRYGWGNSKVSKFLKNLTSEGSIRREVRQGETVLILCKYDDYNDPKNRSKTAARTPTRQQCDSSATAARQNKEGKERKEGNKEKKIEERKKIFLLSLNDFHPEFPKEMIRDFGRHWTEHGDRDRKMRFEKEKTFGVKARLSTWKRNEQKWNTGKKTNQGFSDKLSNWGSSAS